MKFAASGMNTTSISRDPVCGMDVDEIKASAAGRMREYQGKAYYFCADVCRQQFDRNPDRFVKRSHSKTPTENSMSTENPPAIGESSQH